MSNAVKHMAQEAVKSRVKVVWEYARAIILAVILALFIRTFAVQAYEIPSGSMLNTLQVGDHILVNKFVYGIKVPLTDKYIVQGKGPKRGDIIVFEYPIDPSKDFIKRVIGVGGDTIQIINKRILVNGQPLEERYSRFTDQVILPANVQPRDNLGPLVVPPGKLFVMGDNRDESYDSRFWGFVDQSKVKGKAFIIYWSWDNRGLGVRWSRLLNMVD